MKWKVKKSTLSGSIAIPPSKSHTIRALLVATLADGVSFIKKPLIKGDGASAIRAAKGLGAQIQFDGDDLTIKGIGGNYDLGDDFLDMGNSGTSTNLFASAAALGTRTRRIDGDSSLRSRPFTPVLDALSRLGAHYTRESARGDLPFTICGPLHGGATKVSGVSSQFVSSLLFACPLINDSEIEIDVIDLHERPYVEMTIWWLHNMGIRFAYNEALSRFAIPGGQKYNPISLTVPSDFSSATFSAVAAAITGSSVALTGLDFSDPQGDKAIFDILTQAGADVVIDHESTQVSGSGLKGGTFDLNAMPDALPALSVLGCAAEGTCRFVNVAQARIKETDRIKVMHEELSKMGANVEELPDGLVVHQSALKGASVNGHEDHRVVMALALAGMMAEGETIIASAEAAEVTYPTFVEDFQRIGAEIEIV